MAACETRSTRSDTAPRTAASQAGDAYDLIVLGGSLASCFATWRAGQQGHRVLLVERRTFLGSEIAATLRPWLLRDGLALLSPQLRELFLPAEERKEVSVPTAEGAQVPIFGNEIPFFMGTVKKEYRRH